MVVGGFSSFLLELDGGANLLELFLGLVGLLEGKLVVVREGRLVNQVLGISKGKVLGSLEELDDVELGLGTVSDLLDDDLHVGLGRGRRSSSLSRGSSSSGRSRGSTTSRATSVIATSTASRLEHGNLTVGEAELVAEKDHDLVELDDVELGQFIGQLDDVTVCLAGVLWGGACCLEEVPHGGLLLRVERAGCRGEACPLEGGGGKH
mmetsp:Transcript_18533/g.30857  ORF Transcript_18533/g.30857 Transcript_18533/m.30857 type:complete len:207 (-) Transcript_18533:281-901(-)